MCLSAFLNAHLEVDGVAHDVDLDGIEVIEQVTIVPIVVTDGVIVFPQALVEQLLVIDVTFFHAQGCVQIVCGNYGIAHPGDVTDVVALSLFQLDIDIDMFFVDSPYGIFQDSSIAVSQLVILVDKCFLGFVVTLGREFLGLKHVLELACLVDFAKGTFLEHATLDLTVFQLLVALKDDFAYAHLRFLVDGNIQDNLVFAGHIITLDNLDFSILITFFVKVFLGKNLGTVQHVRCNLTAFHDAKLGLHVLTLRFLQSIVVDGADTGTRSQVNAKINL